MSHTIKRNGFTLIEAAVAIAVVAILSGIIVPLVVKNIRDAQVARARNDVQVIAAAIASQMKDTGKRPSYGGGPNGATGGGASIWGSGPAGTPVPTGCGGVGNGQTFANLFTIQQNDVTNMTAAQTMFFTAAPGITVANEFSYRGPYLATDVANKTDPWGRRYIILGYNANGQTGNLPIYVLSAGPDGTITAANYGGGMGPALGVWDQTTAATSNDDIVVRVN